MIPPITTDLAVRIQRTIDTLKVEGVTNALLVRGNPYGVQMRLFGGSTAYMASKVAGPDAWWNRVVGLTQADIPHLDTILAWYETVSVSFWVDLYPGSLTPALGEALHMRGLYPAQYSTVLYGQPREVEQHLPDGVSVREVEQSESELVADVWAEGSGMTEKALRDLRRAAFTVPDNRLYVAGVGDTPAAIATLFVRDGVGYLNAGATLPRYRKSGLHTALTLRRIHDAKEAGCDLLVGYTGTFGSSSQNNMERAGMRVAYGVTGFVKRGE